MMFAPTDRSLKLLKNVAATANLCRTVESALDRVCADILAFTGWHACAEFLPNEEGELVFSSMRGLSPEEAGELEEVLSAFKRVRHPPGRGMPGRILLSKKPEWLSDEGLDLGDPTYPNLRVVRRLGAKTVIAFPLMSSDRVCGILAFYSKRKVDYDALTYELMADIGIQLGRVLERGEAEARLLQSEAALRDAQRLAGIGSSQWDARTDKTIWSEELYRIVGWDPARRPPTHAERAQIYAPESFAKLDQAARRALETGEPYDLQLEIIRPNGERRLVHARGASVRDEGGRTVGLVGTLQDVTDRRRAQEALRASEQRFRSLIEKAPVAMRVSRSDKTLYANKKFRELFAFDSMDDLIGKSPLEQWSPSFRPVVQERSRRREQGLSVADYDGGRGVRKDGSEFAMEVFLAAVELPDGPASLATFVDITERHEAERRLREQATLLDQVGDAIVVTNFSNCITYWNRAAERLFGWKFPEVEGMRPEDIFTEFPMAQATQIRETLNERGVWAGEIVVRARNGNRLTLDMRVTLALDVAGQPRGRLLVCTDITEKKKIQEQFLRAQRLESVGMLAAGITHDLNNVLAPIGMISDLLRPKLQGDKSEEMLNILEECARRGSSLIRQILGFARGVGGESAVVQVKHLLRDMQEMARQTFPKNIEVRGEIPNDLWLVNCNPTQIHQVLLNLCVNARDAMPEGGTLSLAAENCVLDVAAAKVIEGARPGNWLMLSVADTGVGMPPEVLARMWEPFFTTKPIDKGTGLGLPTVLGIVETHGGFITVTSEPGNGTTFRVYLPATETSDLGTVEDAVGVERGQGERILVVDDEKSMRDATWETLSKAGYGVVAVGNGAEAVALLLDSGAEGFVLVITDAEMPVMNGTELVAWVRSCCPQIKILQISGMIRQESAAEVRLGEGADRFLGKPFAAQALLAVVWELLHGAAIAAPAAGAK